MEKSPEIPAEANQSLEAFNQVQMFELHGEGMTIDAMGVGVCPSEELGMMSEFPTGEKTAIVAKVGTGESEFAIVRFDTEYGPNFMVGGLIPDKNGVPKLDKDNFANLSTEVPTIIGRNPRSVDGELLVAVGSITGNNDPDSQDMSVSANHIYISVNETGQIELRDTSNDVTRVEAIQAEPATGDPMTQSLDEVNQLDATNNIENPDAKVEDKNAEKIAKNIEAVNEFLDLELFDNIKMTHDALVEGFGGQLLERSQQARNGMSNISERIQHFERLISGYTAEELSGDFGSGPKRLLAEIAEDVQLLQSRADSIGITEHEHPQVVESISVISTGLDAVLPVIEESAEPENEWLFNFAHTGHQFAAILDRSRSSARYISDISPSLTQNMMNVIHETTQLMNYSSDNPNIKIAIRQNIEAMMNIMEPMRRELHEMINESEHVQMLGHNFMKLIEEKKQ